MRRQMLCRDHNILLLRLNHSICMRNSQEVCTDQPTFVQWSQVSIPIKKAKFNDTVIATLESRLLTSYLDVICLVWWLTIDCGKRTHPRHDLVSIFFYYMIDIISVNSRRDLSVCYISYDTLRTIWAWSFSIHAETRTALVKLRSAERVNPCRLVCVSSLHW